MADELREKLADLEHKRWAHWQSWTQSQCQLNTDGTLTIPRVLVEGWVRQIATPYAELTEREKDSDRKEADKTLALVRAELLALAIEDKGGVLGPLEYAGPLGDVYRHAADLIAPEVDYG